MRGEYKVRGGKLVTVEVTAAGGVLSSARVFGDFFLEPDDALEEINAALVGLPVGVSVAEAAAAISTRLSPQVRLIGFTPEAVAVALRRALGHAVGWEDLTFDLIGPRVLSPAMHVALDEVLPARLAQGRRRPSLRLWDWDRGVVVIGSFQSVRNEVDDVAAARHNIGVVRRATGGGAMFMEPGNCITYSLVVPGSLVEGLSYEQSYAFLDDWVLGALAGVGVLARYLPLNDIATEQGKIGGAAQRRLVDGTVLHHVTMAYDIDSDKMTQVLRTGKEKLSDKGTTSAAKRVDPMRSQTGLPRAGIMAALMAHFAQLYRTVESDYTAEELAEAAELVRTKYATPEWTHRVP